MTSRTAPLTRAALTGVAGILVTPFDRHDAIAPDTDHSTCDRCRGCGADSERKHW